MKSASAPLAAGDLLGGLQSGLQPVSSATGISTGTLLEALVGLIVVILLAGAVKLARRK